MSQSASPQAGAKLRKILMGVGAFGSSVALIAMVGYVATRSPESLEKLLLSVLDKLFLGVAAAGVGFWLQQRLEVFKRDRALASELAKARIAAFHRVFAAVAALDSANNQMWRSMKHARTATTKEEKDKRSNVAADRVDAYHAKGEALLDLIETERFLLGSDFVRAARKWRRFADGRRA